MYRHIPPCKTVACGTAQGRLVVWLAGQAITFYTEDDAWQLRSIVNVVRAAGCEVPEWMLQLKKERRRNHTKTTVKAPKTLEK